MHGCRLRLHLDLQASTDGVLLASRAAGGSSSSVSRNAGRQGVIDEKHSQLRSKGAAGQLLVHFDSPAALAAQQALSAATVRAMEAV